jgi:hypothetical protein
MGATRARVETVPALSQEDRSALRRQKLAEAALPNHHKGFAKGQYAAFGGRPELLVPQLLERELELLDQQCPCLSFRLRGQAGRSLGA